MINSNNSSPPKKNSHSPKKYKKLTWSELKHREDYFEHRLDKYSHNYYLFNPYSGETILDTSIQINRSQSSWKKPDAYPNEVTKGTILYPEFYGSRREGCRQFFGYDNNEEKAAIHITSVCRGMISRLRLRKYYRENFHKVFDIDSGFYYFVNIETGATTWNKPILANPSDISPKTDPEFQDIDHDQYNQYSKGPMITKKGLGKKHIGKFQAMIIPKKVEEPPPEPEIIDFEDVPYRVCIVWLDSKVQKLSGYAAIRIARDKNDWTSMLRIMQEQSDTLLTQIYGLYSMSRMDIEFCNNSGVVTQPVCDSIEFIIQTLLDGKSKPFGAKIPLFCLLALIHIFGNHSGRVEFFRLPNGFDQGRTHKAEEYIIERIKIFSDFLDKCPLEFHFEQIDKNSNMKSITYPTIKGAEYVELVLTVISVLAHEADFRDLVCETCCKSVLNIIKESANHYHSCLFLGLKCLYNFIFMNRENFDYFHEHTNVYEIIEMVKSGGNGTDSLIKRELRRVELSLKENGWSGRVEELMTIEMENSPPEISE